MNLPPFQVLLDEHGSDIYRFLLGSVGFGEVDDCYQETFLAALRAYPRLKEAGNLRGWLFTIAHHKAMDAHRKRRREHEVPLPEELRAADLPESDEALWSLVRLLPSKQRAAIVLRFIGGFRYREIGGIVDCSEPAARQNVRAGLAKLRKELDR